MHDHGSDMAEAGLLRYAESRRSYGSEAANLMQERCRVGKLEDRLRKAEILISSLLERYRALLEKNDNQDEPELRLEALNLRAEKVFSKIVERIQKLEDFGGIPGESLRRDQERIRHIYSATTDKISALSDNGLKNNFYVDIAGLEELEKRWL